MPVLNLGASDFVPSMTFSFNPLSEPKPISIITPIPTTISTTETKPMTTEGTGKKKKEKKVTVKEEDKPNEAKKTVKNNEVAKEIQKT